MDKGKTMRKSEERIDVFCDACQTTHNLVRISYTRNLKRNNGKYVCSETRPKARKINPYADEGKKQCAGPCGKIKPLIEFTTDPSRCSGGGDGHYHKCKVCCRKDPNDDRSSVPKILTTEIFLERAIEKWKDIYDYKDTICASSKTKIKFGCPKHGIIEQFPLSHIKSGCPYCSGRGIGKHTKETLIEKANSVHNCKYDYSKIDFKSIRDKITIICPKHGEFLQSACNHINLINGCPICAFSASSSRAEQEIINYILTFYNGSIETHNRVLLDGKEIDIYLPEFKIGVEYGGAFYHRESMVGKTYHFDKYNLAKFKGIKLIQIFDFEWLEKNEIVKSRIKGMLGFNEKIPARKTIVKELNRIEANDFLSRTHIQDGDNSSIRLGLIFNDKLVACMTFNKPRFNKKNNYELIRFSSELNTNVIGGASKLLSYFRKNYNGSIISYADCRWSNGNLYEKLGFTLDGIVPAGYIYYNISNKKTYHRMTFQKHKLKELPAYDDSLTEYEIMTLSGYDRIWNAGNLRYVLD